MSVLTIILGETRSHELTWTNFKKHVLEELNSDLAVCVGSTGESDDPFTKNAKYVWTYPEQSRAEDGWADAFTKEVCGGSEDWKILILLRDQLFGGLCKEHKGSGGISLFFRWFLRENLLKNDLTNEYDYFIVTRSDYYWDSPHTRVFFEDPDSIFIPNGEDCPFSISDRHMVIPSKYILKVLDTTNHIVNSPVKLFYSMRDHKNWNIEKYIKYHFCIENLLEKIRYFPRNAYAVRSDTAKTRWAEGVFNPEINMVVKYPSEYQLVKRNKYSL